MISSFSRREIKSGSQSGFTLLELLLVIGIAAVLFLGISQITASWIDSEVSNGAGQHLQRVSTIVENYVQANWDNLTNTPDAMNDADPSWAGLKTALDQEGLLTNGELFSPLSTQLKVAFVKDSTDATHPIYRASIYSSQTLPYQRVIQAARQAGNTGGMISFFPDSTNAFGAFGQWKIGIAKLLPDGSAPCVPDNGNACLVAVISYSQQTLCGSVLYRKVVDGCADGNTMSTNLEMASHNITNANNIDTDNLNVKNTATVGSATVNGDTTFNGPVTASNGMTINGTTTVSGDANFSGNVNMSSGDLNVTALNANSVQAAKVSTNEMHAENLTMTDGTLAVDNDVSINGSINMDGASSQIAAGTVNAGQVNTGTGSIVTGTMNVVNSMNITGNVALPTGATLSADKLVANQCVEVTETGKKYGNCP